MNYIIISDAVADNLKQQYAFISNQYGYTKAFDIYMYEKLSYDGVFRLWNRCYKETTYYLIGKKCILYLEKHKKYQNCFYGRKIKFYEDDTECLSKLSQSVELPGEWDVIQFSEIQNVNLYETQSINDFLAGLKASESEFYEFEAKWKAWDIYNAKLKEEQMRRELESECEVKSVLVENNIFTLQLVRWTEDYSEDVEICVQLQGEKNFQLLGVSVFANKGEKKIGIRCENHDFVKAYLAGKTGSIIKIRRIDFGTAARLKRQRIAMQKLFRNETANPNLKEIIMGGYDFSKENLGTYTLADAYGLFGTNMRQKEAYVGALNADNIYLIQGPPGTGKTTIIAEIIKHVVGQKQRVLVSSETNIAVDNALERISYTDNVIPVRLGREERVGATCVKYMPERIVDSIIKASVEQLTLLEEEGVSCDNLVHKCEATWIQKINAVEEEIQKLNAQLPDDWDVDVLYEQIEDYEKLIIEMNDIHNELLHEKYKYNTLKNDESGIQKEKNELEAYVKTVQAGAMQSGFAEVDSEQGKNLPSYIRQLKKKEQQLNEIQNELSQNRYETLKGSYQRKNRRYEREKNKFKVLNIAGYSLIASLHMIKNNISDSRFLQNQKENFENQKEEEIQRIREDFARKQELWEKSTDIRSEWIGAVGNEQLKKDIERIYTKKVNVVFATCAGIVASDNGNFVDREYDYVVIDEAAKCNMLDLLIPLVLGKKIILVGDHKQLYPMIETDGVKASLSEEQLKLIKEHILFKWLYEERVSEANKIMLNRQYRMPYDISQFISSRFYNNELICEKDATEEKIMVWIDSEKAQEHKIGTTYENEPEADIIMQLLAKLDGQYACGTEVGVICTYKAQTQRIAKQLENTSFDNIIVECSTVDAFQGKEKHTIIFNVVRSERVTDYMKDENRVNVAVSRVQERLYVVGNLELMKTKNAGSLGNLYQYIKQNGEVHNSRYVRWN